MFDANAVNLVLSFLFAIGMIWLLIRWVTKPVMTICFDNVETTTMYGNQRIVEHAKLQSLSGDKELNVGMNDFYVTIKDGLVRYHHHGQAGLLNPILRSSDEILFFRLQIRVVGKRIVKFDQTNLSKPNARLLWSRA